MKTLKILSEIELTEENFSSIINPNKIYHVELSNGTTLLTKGTIITNNDNGKNIYMWGKNGKFEFYHTALCLFEEISFIRPAYPSEEKYFESRVVRALTK